ncbi:hypothetical protein HAPAU_22840 [Halalkalicoccus paucihalophilus]|uniref:Sulfatase n=1 Tax=Halalkalicoccus paucihalophilus TaxID=1008153 RepID=A0A151AD96_9EURY|nr:hypothetical protein [Halalkalicoccus paucihalophilus]KYH25609.1 hypothetical protein HAPAU_22840 [Halalkalicoccus paucihalophilus]
MYSAFEIRRALANPVRIGLECNRLYHRRGYRRAYNPSGVDVFAEDWDSLILLDACRYDLFERHSRLPGDLQSRTSRGSGTAEFLRGNVAGRDLRDTVYVTANPQLYRYREELNATFHDVIHVWMAEGWDEEYGTVLPETTTRYAREAAERYPEKRLFVHYLQPHYPFVGSETTFDKGHVEDPDGGEDVFWLRLTDGRLDVDRETVWDAYAKNLDLVLPYVESLLEEFEGRTVVTSDHGNLFDERVFPLPMRVWGHPKGIHVENLVKVPWLVHETGTRKEVAAAAPVSEGRTVGEDVVADRLEALGYV